MNQNNLKLSKLTLKKCLIALMFLTGFINAQNITVPSGVEKIYLHTDRSSYTMGESLWYKAYDVLAYNHLLFDQSNILYVELISPDSKIIARNKTRIVSGLGHGDFKLSDSLGVKEPGIYQLRAYTNYNRNFGDDFIFKKHIEIIDVFNDGIKKNVPKKNIQQKSKYLDTESIKSPTINFQFFPEGGNLVDNVLSVVAFKAEDEHGYPVEILGRILDSEGHFITGLATFHNGMGHFNLRPSFGIQYKAEITTKNGGSHVFLLPKVSATGYLLGRVKKDDKDLISVRTNEKTLELNTNQTITLLFKVRGITYFEGTLVINSKGILFELPKGKLPEGICQVTIYDADSRPLSERLIYFEKEDKQDIEVNLEIPKQVYKPGETTEVLVSVKNKEGQPVLGSFSLSSVDVNSVTLDPNLESNICSYFLMESDIRGKIFNPGLYFDQNNSKRFRQLDLLLLTQGWRDFKWKYFPETTRNPEYKIEKGFQVSGMVKQLLGNKPKPNNNITLSLLNKKEGIQLFSSVTDSLGQFNIKDLSFIGTTTMLINTSDQKGKSKGELLLGRLEREPMPTNFNYKAFIKDTIVKESIKKHVYDKYIAYGVSPENVLDEVEIIAKKKEETPSYYGAPDNKYVVDENTPPFNSIYMLIQYLVPGVLVTNETVRFMRFNGPAHIILDGFPVFSSSDINYIMPDNVERIEVFKGPTASIFGAEGSNGVILIYTKRGTEGNRPKKVFHSISKTVEGFYDARVFYIPTNENLNFENNDAIRNTLYWNPYVHPDKMGSVKVEYNNGKVETDVRVTLEGLTINGVPLVKHATYKIKK